MTPPQSTHLSWLASHKTPHADGQGKGATTAEVLLIIPTSGPHYQTFLPVHALAQSAGWLSSMSTHSPPEQAVLRSMRTVWVPELHARSGKVYFCVVGTYNSTGKQCPAHMGEGKEIPPDCAPLKAYTKLAASCIAHNVVDRVGHTAAAIVVAPAAVAFGMLPQDWKYCTLSITSSCDLGTQLHDLQETAANSEQMSLLMRPTYDVQQAYFAGACCCRSTLLCIMLYDAV